MKIWCFALFVALPFLSGPVHAKSKTLVIDGKQFSEKIVTLKKGDRLTVVNRSGLNHFVWGHQGDVAFDLRGPSDTNNLQTHRPGDSRSMTFTRPGRYRLGCALHEVMQAWVVVEE